MKPAEVGALAIGVAVLGVAVYVWKKGGIGGAVADLAAGAVGVANSAAGGVVNGLGDVIGIPRTSQTECERAISEGRTWDASFACPAGQFLGSLWTKSASPESDLYPNESARFARYQQPGVETDIFDHYTDPMGNGF